MELPHLGEHCMEKSCKKLGKFIKICFILFCVKNKFCNRFPADSMWCLQRTFLVNTQFIYFLRYFITFNVLVMNIIIIPLTIVQILIKRINKCQYVHFAMNQYLLVMGNILMLLLGVILVRKIMYSSSLKTFLNRILNSSLINFWFQLNSYMLEFRFI